MNYLKIEKASTANGIGVRTVLWVSGCDLHCKGCHNPEAWDFQAGKLFDFKAQEELYTALSKPYIQGITFSGGHPLEIENQICVEQLIKDIRRKFPTKDIWLYTGLTLLKEDLCGYPEYGSHDPLYIEYVSFRNSILQQCDVVVDGAYIESLRDTTIPFRGSTNQRLIDVKASMRQNKIIEFEI